MGRERPTVQAITGDGPILVAVLDVLGDLYDLLDARLPVPYVKRQVPVPVSEPAPDGPAVSGRPVAEPGPPPRVGRGSSLAAWQAWADTAGVTVPDDATRDQIIDACARAGVLT